MKRIIAAAAVAALSINLSAEEAKWLRFSDISPDGSTIAFSYQGDIFTVNANGGRALQLTTNPAYDTRPIWTADGTAIVFASYREGSKDIYIIDAQGGAPRRITTYNGSETPLSATADGKVLFSADIQQDPTYGGFPGEPQLWSADIATGRLTQVTSLTVSNISFNTCGKAIYEDYKGYEDPLRKHHTSSVTRDIYIYDPSDASFTKLSAFEGENRNPVFAADGNHFYYLAENGGSFNVYRSSLTAPAETEQITDFSPHPVRNLSISDSDLLAFSYNGELYTCQPGSEPHKVAIDIIKDVNTSASIRRSIASGASAMAVSPDGKEVALVAHGDVFVTAVDYPTTRRITNTPQQERDICFSPDGKSLYYSAERDGEWAVWKTVLTGSDKHFTWACDFAESRVTPQGKTCFQPQISPDGKWLAYLRDRDEIEILNLETQEVRVLLENVNYSYSDGDQSFEWSPDSRYILTGYMGEGGWNNSDVAVIDIEDATLVNLTQSGYSDGGFRWAMGGKAMTWSTDRDGYRSHGSWGTTDNIYAMFFDGPTMYRFRREKELDDLEQMMAVKDTSAKADTIKYAPDWYSVEDRIVPLTGVIARLGDHYLTPDGKTLYYTQQLENGADLCRLDVKKGDIQVVRKGVSGRFCPDAKGENLFILNGSGMCRLNLASGKLDNISFNSEYDWRPAEERSYIFEHAWKQVDEKFYDASIHGVDWQMMHDNYAQFLPYIDNNFDFQDLLSELLGELNASHTGGRYYYTSGLNTGHLGVLFDLGYEGDGLSIAESLPGGCLPLADSGLKPGDIITSIDGKQITAGTCWFDALAGTAGKRLRLTISTPADSTSITRTVFVTPEDSDYDHLYHRWVRQREQMVFAMSAGRIGYVHVEGMDSPSFRTVFSKALGKYRSCDAIIIDTRHNGGGWLTDDLCTLFGGHEYVKHTPRGQYIGLEPFNKWTKPSCVLMGEDNYSDACGFPFAYKSLGIGKLIGAPVPGTMTAVWWERQIDPTLVFGIPQVTCTDSKTGKPIENNQVEPDILVYNEPLTTILGSDPQLEAAVSEMLEQVDNE